MKTIRRMARNATLLKLMNDGFGLSTVSKGQRIIVLLADNAENQLAV